MLKIILIFFYCNHNIPKVKKYHINITFFVLIEQYMKQKLLILLGLSAIFCLPADGQKSDLFISFFRCRSPLTGTCGANDNIGLAFHERHLRGCNDTLTVTTRYDGWTVDSIMAYEKTYESQVYPIGASMFYLSRKDKRRIAKGMPFEKPFRWLILKTERQKLAFAATPTSWLDRRAMVYLHKGDYKDSIIVTKGTIPVPVPSIDFVGPIDLYPESCIFPAGGGIFDVTTKRTTWWVESISVSTNYDYPTDVRTFSQEEKDDRVARQECEAEFEWVRLENKGKEIKMTVQPNTTGKSCYFRCNYSIYLIVR